MKRLKIILLEENSGMYHEYPIVFTQEASKEFVGRLLKEAAEELTELYLAAPKPLTDRN